MLGKSAKRENASVFVNVWAEAAVVSSENEAMATAPTAGQVSLMESNLQPVGPSSAAETPQQREGE
jgi:hypothetical protein